MGRAVVAGAVVVTVLLILAGVYIWTLRRATRTKGDLSFAEERRLRQLTGQAAQVMSGLGVGSSIDESDLLRPQSRSAVDEWLGRYNQFRKDTERA